MGLVLFTGLAYTFRMPFIADVEPIKRNSKRSDKKGLDKKTGDFGLSTRPDTRVHEPKKTTKQAVVKTRTK